MERNETVPEFVAQFLFILLLSAVMFVIGFFFPPASAKKRIKAAANGDSLDW